MDIATTRLRPDQTRHKVRPPPPPHAPNHPNPFDNVQNKNSFFEVRASQHLCGVPSQKALKICLVPKRRHIYTNWTNIVLLRKTVIEQSLHLQEKAAACLPGWSHPLPPGHSCRLPGGRQQESLWWVGGSRREQEGAGGKKGRSKGQEGVGLRIIRR